MLWVLTELHRQVDAIQMSTHNICLHKEVKKKYTGYNLKTTEFLDCALIGVCAVIRSNTVDQTLHNVMSDKVELADIQPSVLDRLTKLLINK